MVMKRMTITAVVLAAAGEYTMMIVMWWMTQKILYAIAVMILKHSLVMDADVSIITKIKIM